MKFQHEVQDSDLRSSLSKLEVLGNGDKEKNQALRWLEERFSGLQKSNEREQSPFYALRET